MRSRILSGSNVYEQLSRGVEKSLESIGKSRLVGRYAGRDVALGDHVLVLFAPLLALALAAVLWAVSLPRIDPRQINDFGLVSVLPPLFFVALAIVAVSFGLALSNLRTPSWLLFAHVGLLIAIIHGTPIVAYDGVLRYTWAWKHVGVVDYIMRHGSVDLSKSAPLEFAPYFNWPGFFALGALFTEAAGFSSPLQFVGVGPVFFNLCYVGALWLISGALVVDKRQRWLAVWIFVLGNWVGQDYFAPQAYGYFLFLVIVGIGLTWFSTRPRSGPEVAGSHEKVGWLEAFWHRLSGPADRVSAIERKAKPLERVGLMGAIILMYVVAATSHQLTPVMMIISIGALVLAHRFSARSLPILMAVITITWMVFVAWNFVSENVQWIVGSIGEIQSNAAVTGLSGDSFGQKVVVMAARGLSLAIWLMALTGLVRRWRGGQRDLSYLLLAGAPFVMFLAGSYGGEMIFRVYLFTLPFMGFFAASLFFPSLVSGRSWRTPVGVIAVSLVLLVGLLFSYYGRERMHYFTQNEVDASTYLYDNAPPGSLVVDASWDFPAKFQDIEEYSYINLVGDTVSGRSLQRLQTNPISSLSIAIRTREQLDNRSYQSIYVIITRSQKEYLHLYNIVPPGTIDHVEQVFRQSSQFKLIYQNQDAEIFTFSK